MALFVQIDHFRKTDQKPTVKNHLFSISWFRSFNRTSFQQQLKRCFSCWIKAADGDASIVHPFNNNWNRSIRTGAPLRKASIVHPFNNNLNIRSGVSAVKTASFNRTSFQQQLKLCLNICALCSLRCFNRTSFQQQLKHSTLGPSLPPS